MTQTWQIVLRSIKKKSGHCTGEREFGFKGHRLKERLNLSQLEKSPKTNITAHC